HEFRRHQAVGARVGARHHPYLDLVFLREGPLERVPVGAQRVTQSLQRRLKLFGAHLRPSSCSRSFVGAVSTRVTPGAPPRGPNVSTTAETPALLAPATTTSTASGEVRTWTGPCRPS